MAKAVAIVDTPVDAPKKGPSLVIQIVVLLVLTLVAAGVGYFSGGMLDPGSAKEEHAAAPAQDGGHGGKEEKPEVPEDPAEAEKKRGLFPLPAITTNLAAPSDTWIRIELSAIFDGEIDTAMADAVHQDLLSYLRTVKLHQVEGASGFLHLKEDIEERATIRSEGKVKGLLIKTIVFE
jgi:flagellar FliL protein